MGERGERGIGVEQASGGWKRDRRGSGVVGMRKIEWVVRGSGMRSRGRWRRDRS